MFTPCILAIGLPGDLQWLWMAPLILLFASLIPAFFMGFWNSTMPEVFNLKPITFWQAFKLLVIAGFLCGGLANCNREKNVTVYLGQPPYQKVK